MYTGEIAGVPLGLHVADGVVAAFTMVTRHLAKQTVFGRHWTLLTTMQRWSAIAVS